MNVVDCIQGDSVWFQCHVGAITASRVADVVAKRQKSSKGKSINYPLQCVVDMRWELIEEKLTGHIADNYVSRWMKEGIEKEPLARNEYELRMDVSVEQVGFVYHPTIKDAGCSPDGLVGDDGLIEIKCPKLSTHLRYITENVIPEEYLPQMLWQLSCCPERQWNDFVSFSDVLGLPEEFQFFRKRLPRNDEANAIIRGMELEVDCFLESVEKEYAALKESRLRAIQEYKAVTA